MKWKKREKIEVKIKQKKNLKKNWINKENQNNSKFSAVNLSETQSILMIKWMQS